MIGTTTTTRFALVPVRGMVKGTRHVVDYAIVDAEDFARVSAYRWHLHKRGYAKDREYMHRVVCRNPDGVVDHRNHDPLDNRKCNLRVCDQSVNVFNRSGPTRANRSGFRGVDRWRGSWRARVIYRGREISKTFPTAEQADIWARGKRAEIEHAEESKGKATP